MQCTAFRLNDIRCNNKVVNNSLHCEYHRDKARKLYFKYKDLHKKCEYIENTPCTSNNIDDKIDYHTKLYAIYKKIYVAREKHTKYAFVPECRDEGHNYQFNLLNDKMNDCHKILENLLKIKKNTRSEPNVFHEPEKEQIVIKPTIVRKQQRLDKTLIEQINNGYINSCIEENKVYAEQKKKLIYCLRKAALKLYFEDEEIINSTDDDHAEFFGIWIFELIFNLLDNNILRSPPVLLDGHDICYYIFRFSDSKIQNCTMYEYLDEITSFDFLKGIFKIILFQPTRDNIQAILDPLYEMATEVYMSGNQEENFYCYFEYDADTSECRLLDRATFKEENMNEL
jgi:hypothetical protein